jgi:Ni/Fe-hydrogenase subunit HybB-like protein
MTDIPAPLATQPERPGRNRRPPHTSDPVVLSTPSIASMTDQICALAQRERAFLWLMIALVLALLLTGVLVGAIFWLFYAGVGIWGIDWPAVWGFAIINYVWWIAIASGGTFISALFYLTKVEWRTSLNRIAETMTVFAAAGAGIYPILHLGRPWLFYWLFPYPDTMNLWPQFRSPLLWDFFAILTYVTSSILFWYFGLIPDLATMRDRADSRGKQTIYGVMALGFRGSDRQWQHYQVTYGVLAAIMAPLVISVHSIVGLDFAGAATVGWHSTEFPPFFVFGALLSGFAMVLLLIVPPRRLLGLEDFITGRHFDVICKMLLVSSLYLAYAYVTDAFTTTVPIKGSSSTRSAGPTPPCIGRPSCSTSSFLNSWVKRLRLNEPLIMLVCFGVIVGMWCERYTIVVMSLRRTHLPSAWGNYYPTFWDWATLFGTVGLFASGILLAVRFLPVISMFEMRALIKHHSQEGERE